MCKKSNTYTGIECINFGKYNLAVYNNVGDECVLWLASYTQYKGGKVLCM